MSIFVFCLRMKKVYPKHFNDYEKKHMLTVEPNQAVFTVRKGVVSP